MNRSASRDPDVLMLVGDTIGKQRRTGIQRVVVETARALVARNGPGAGRFDLVRWDALEGRLRFLDQDELNGVFGLGDWPPSLRLRRESRRVGQPFHEQLASPRDTWILSPEVAWHEADGVGNLARAMAHCREWGGRFAGVFYDLIPIRNPSYAEHAAQHEAYLAELVKADLLLSISKASAEDLGALWNQRGVSPHPPIIPLLLPDGGFRRALRRTGPAAQRIVLFGTIEPRKRQVEVLKAMESARASRPELASWEVVTIGSVHGAIAHEFGVLVRRNAWLTHLDYVSDARLSEILSTASFTVFASDDEGYGLPIAESLASGLPCLCANFGSMAEIAAGGGCLAVDVRQPALLEAGLIELCAGPEMLERLQTEIARRVFDSWADYADRAVETLRHTLRIEQPAPVAVEAAPADFGEGVVDEAAFERLARADVASFSSERQIESFIRDADRRAWPRLLPPAVLASVASAVAERVAADRSRRMRLAEVEAAYGQARRSIPGHGDRRGVFLRVLVSTYNRRDFVVANVRWILGRVFGNSGPPFDLVVVDGGSTDGTVEALHRIKDRRFRLVESPVNMGMLGGIREASRLSGAEYTWLVGDDDFIDPASFQAIADALQTHLGAPFAFTNFSVYHRAALAPSDTVGRLVLEGRPVAETVAPSGVMPVSRIAEQTDNLFTAIYTIIWRTDLLSAAYEHSFEGPPFEDLTQSIPCTEFILDRYAACDAYWHAPSGVTGNAHNSWSRHRPRWHGVIMPMAFDLALRAGVDPVRLQTWAETHRRLMDEAMEIAGRNGGATVLGAEHADLALRTFRRRQPGFEAP